MAIIEKANGKYQVDIKAQGRKRLRRTFETRSDAERAERQYKAGELINIDQGTKTTLKTIQTALSRDLESTWSQPDSTPLRVSKQVLDYFGADRDPTTITLPDVNEWKDYMLNERCNTKGAVDRKLSALNVMLQYGMENEMCGTCVRVKLTKKSKREVKEAKRVAFLTREYEPRFLEVVKMLSGKEWRDYFIILIETGCRTKELGFAYKKDVLFNSRELNLEKNIHRDIKAGHRLVPLSDRALEAFKRQMKRYPRLDRLFPHFTQAKLNSTHWPKYREALDNHVRTFVPHITRHTCATRLCEEGNDPALIQYWMGHESLQSTHRYIHIDPARVKHALDKRLKFEQNMALKDATRDMTRQDMPRDRPDGF